MADELKFNIVANADQVNKTLSDLKSSSKEIQENLKLKDFAQDTEGLNKTVNKLAELNRELSKMRGATSRGGRILDSTDQSSPDVQKEVDALKKQTDEAVAEYKKAANILRDQISSGFRYSDQGSYNDSNYSKSSTQNEKARERAIGSARQKADKANINRGNYLPPVEDAQYESFKTRVGDVRNQRTQFVKTGDVARGRGAMTFAQQKRYQQSTRDFMYDYQGVDPEEALKLAESGGSIRDVDPKNISDDSLRGESINIQKDMEKVISQLTDELNTLSRNTDLSDTDKTARANEISAELDSAQRMSGKAQEMITVLDNGFNSTISEIKEMDATLKSGNNIRMAPDPDSTAGKIDSRSNVVALAAIAASVYGVTSTFNQGRQASESMRPASQTIGYRTGEDDYRSIRTNAMLTGRDYGYSGEEVLEVSESILGSRGVTNDADLQTATLDAMQFRKYSGASEQTAGMFNETLSSTGASTDMVSDLESAVLGGIQSSGMKGREEEQISALNGIIQNQKQGFNVSDEQLSGRLAMANVLSQSGGRAFQGQGLENFFASADSSIRGSDMYSDLGLMLGVGTDIQGPGALYEYEVMTDQGLTPDTFNKLLESLQLSGVSDSDNLAAIMENMLGIEVDTAALSDIVAEAQSGSLSEESLQAQLESAQQTGDATLEDRNRGYQESADSARDMDAANEVIKAVNVFENTSTDILAQISQHTSKIGTGGGLQSVLTTGIGTLLGSAGGNLLGSVGSGLLSSLIGILTSGKGDSVKEIFSGGTGGGPVYKIKEFFSNIGSTVAGSGIFRGIKNVGGNVLTKGKDLFTGAGTATKAATQTAKGAGQNMLGRVANSTVGQYFTGNKGAGRGSALLAGAGRAFRGYNDIQEAEEGQKGRATGEAIGGTAGTIGGGILGTSGGAALGATVGTMIGGPLGTLVGGGLGLAGSALGSWLGDKAGSSAGGWLGGLFDSGEETPVEETQDSSEKSQAMRQERLRQSNVSLETTNLDRQETALKEASRILSDASSQNGIIGSTDASNTATNNSEYITGQNTTAIGGLTPGQDMSYLEEQIPDYIKNWTGSMRQPIQTADRRKTPVDKGNTFGDTNINVNVNYSGDASREESKTLANTISATINERFTKEMIPI